MPLIIVGGFISSPLPDLIMNIQDIGITGVITLITLAFAIIGFLKGLIRTALAMVCLALAGYAALWGYEHSSELTGSWFDEPNPWIPKIGAGVSGLVVFILCRKLLKFISNPFDDSDKKEKGFGFGMPAALICLAIGLLILWGGLTGTRYIGSFAELRHTRYLAQDADDKTAARDAKPWLLDIKQTLDTSTLGKWQRSTDPFYTPGHLTLCQLLVMYNHTPTRVQMLTFPEIHKVLNNPLFIELAFDDEMKAIVESGKPRELFKHQGILQALEENQLRKDVLALADSWLNDVYSEPLP